MSKEAGKRKEELENRKEHDSSFRYDDLLDMKYEDFCRGGADGCYGLVMEVCRRLGSPLPEYRVLALDAITQEEVNQFRPRWKEVETPKPGDLVLIRKMDMEGYHIGVMIARGIFLHAVREHGVMRTRLSHPLYRDRIEGIYRYKGKERENRKEKIENLFPNS